MALLARLYQKLLGLPVVYERIRPLVVGGVDMRPAYANLEASADDVIVDVGCGTGDALNYLTGFRAYHGFDNDALAVGYARRRFGDRPNVVYHSRSMTADDLRELGATRVMLAGLLHHLSDDQALRLLADCAAVPTVRRIATQDVVYLPGALVSNVLAALDRGKHVRHTDGFRRLAESAGLRVVKEEIVRSHPTRGRALYFLMALESPEAAPPRPGHGLAKG
jgi:SAM-dependent methyltransferase